MKTFNGAEFLKENACEVNLSNGKKFIVSELSQGMLAKIQSLPDDATEEQFVDLFAQLLGANIDDIKDIGLVESRGAVDFLFGNLLPQK